MNEEKQELQKPNKAEVLKQLQDSVLIAFLEGKRIKQLCRLLKLSNRRVEHLIRSAINRHRFKERTK